MQQTPPLVKAFLREIGRKGGRRSAQHPQRRHLNKKAAESRWRKTLPEPKSPGPEAGEKNL